MSVARTCVAMAYAHTCMRRVGVSGRGTCLAQAWDGHRDARTHNSRVRLRGGHGPVQSCTPHHIAEHAARRTSSGAPPTLGMYSPAGRPTRPAPRPVCVHACARPACSVHPGDARDALPGRQLPAHRLLQRRAGAVGAALPHARGRGVHARAPLQGARPGAHHQPERRHAGAVRSRSPAGAGPGFVAALSRRNGWEGAFLFFAAQQSKPCAHCMHACTLRVCGRALLALEALCGLPD